ncbi:MAG: hypothetical protein HY686_00780 [Chloroflexi bacterium]|nr:hypothetical protein [Chloroflexota bacterium]
MNRFPRVRLKNPYLLLGLGLLLGGGAFALVAYFLVASVPLTALGITGVMMGALCLGLARALPSVPPEVSRALLETGIENLSALLEELGLRSRAIYLPSSLCDGSPRALVPLHTNPSIPEVRRPVPRRLIVKYGPEAEEVGLLVTTPGSIVVKMLGQGRAPSGADLDGALTQALVGLLDMAAGVTASQSGQTVTVTISRPRLQRPHLWVVEVLGSPLASVVASVVAEALNRPVTIQREEPQQQRSTIVLEVQGQAL